MSHTLALPLQALVWGGIAGLALVLGALVGYYARLPARVASSVMAFGTGVLVSALAFDLMDDAADKGGAAAAALGFTIGAALYAAANAILAAQGAKHRKRSDRPNAAGGASLAIALGALLDGVPESSAIGASLLDGEGVAIVTVFAIFISNFPEGLSSAAGMRKAGRSAAYVFAIWGGIALACAVSAWLGYVAIGPFGPFVVATAIATAAGAILVMLVETMIPEAFENMHSWTGPIAASGFLVAFVASRVFG